VSQLRNRRGFTLVELLIALVLLGLVSTAIYQVLNTNQRTYLAQTQRIDLQQNIRAGAAILPGEFRTLDAGEGDIQAPMTATSITIRAIRKLGFMCAPPTLGGGLGNNIFTARVAPAYGNGAFVPNDSVLVYWEGDPTTRSDDSWIPGQVQKIDAPTAGGCADAGTPGAPHPGYVVTLNSPWPVGNASSGVAFNTPNMITNGSPVYGFQTVTYALWQSSSDGRWYVGMTIAGQPTQPLIGPLTGPNGLTFNYYDANGAVTAVPAQVAQIEIILRAETVAQVRPGYTNAPAYQIDSVDTRVALRNNPRCGPCS
jgi:prepilin-type N-terminal cleavage/methylation domain-containing protein